MNEKTNTGDLILLRGLPGIDKRALGKAMLQSSSNHDPEILTNEDYYFENNITESNENNDKFAINHCQMKCAERMRQNISKIVVSNAFTKTDDIVPYVEMAKRYNYRVHTVLFEKIEDLLPKQ